MMPRVKRAFALFSLSVALLLGLLWNPILKWSKMEETVTHLETLSRQQEAALLQASSLQKEATKQRTHWEIMKEKGFMTPFEAREVRNLLLILKNRHHVFIRQIGILETTVISLTEEDTPFQTAYTPISITLQGLSEKALYGVIKDFNESFHGIVIPRRLKLTSLHRHDFKLFYECVIVRGTAPPSTIKLISTL